MCTRSGSEAGFPDKHIILASNSPRRKELLAALGVDFTVDTENSFVEEYGPSVRHEDVPVLMSEGKSMGFHRQLEEDEVLLTADTMVLCGDAILGKPSGREDAIRMLGFLSGKEHIVISAVTLRDTRRMLTRTDRTAVRFRQLSEEDIIYYIDKFRPFDKAGSYGIQEWIGYVGISGITGSFFNVMGFPTHLVHSMLKEFCKADLLP